MHPRDRPTPAYRTRMNSREKGKRGERELAAFLREHGIEARRGQQFSGVEGEDVVHAIPNVHIECKRVENLRLHDALAQAIRDAKGKMPVVAHKRNRGGWVAILRLEDLLIWLKEMTL